MSNITVDIGELCTHCFQDTSSNADNGKWVDRIPSDADAKIVSDNTENIIYIGISGYMCYTCRLIECDKCHKLVSETEHYDDDGEVLLLCGLCYIEKTVSQGEIR
jgi:hypothetical protein